MSVDQTYWDNWLDDTFSRAGAEGLKARIEAYWRARGHEVTITVEKRGFVPTLRGAHWVLRSNMVGGWPSPVERQDERRAA